MSLIIRAVFILIGLTLITLVSLYCDYRSLPSAMILLMRNNLRSTDSLHNYFIPPAPDLRSFIMNAKLKIRPKNTNLTKRSTDDCNLVVIVTSSLNNSEARKAIRETWGQIVSKLGQKLYFLVGVKNQIESVSNDTNLTHNWVHKMDNKLNSDIEDEALLYGDIIQYVFIDSYFNLTLKSLLMMRFFIEELLHLNLSQMLTYDKKSFLTLVDRNHNYIKEVFLMKTDEDMFVHIENLVILTAKLSKYLKKVSKKPMSLLSGHLIRHALPVRSKFNKYYMPSRIFRDREFPDYLSGTAYLSTSNAVVNILTASLTEKCRFLHLEDIYLTGICASKVGIKRYNHNGFNIFKVDPKNICFYKSAITISSHDLSPIELRQVWNGLRVESNNKIDCKKNSERSQPNSILKGN